MKKKHRALANKLDATFDPEVTAVWRAMVEAWDADHGKADPYEEPETGAYKTIVSVNCAD